MKLLRNITMAGVATLAVGTVAFAPQVNAVSLADSAPSLSSLTKKQKLMALDSKSNAAVDVSTELNCSDHTLIAKVTNKTSSTITPEVTFNELNPTFPSGNDLPIEPGKTGNYTWSYSGNHLLVDVETRVDTYDPLMVSPTLHCNEPVSFMVSETSESAVTGTLTNNSSFVSQTVFTRVNGGDVRVEQLEPRESRLIALPFSSLIPDPDMAFVALGTDAGYEGTYSVDLDLPIVGPLPR